jgi:hypothetical protein
MNNPDSEFLTIFRRLVPKLDMADSFDQVDWTKVDYVVGTREPVSPLVNFKWQCATCRQAVYTGMRYPDGVKVVCDVCAAGGALEEPGSR